MFAKREKFNIIVAVFLKVWYENPAKLFIIVPVVGHFSRLLERACMKLIYVQRLVYHIAALFHPVSIIKFKCAVIPCNGSVIRTSFHKETVGIAVIRKFIAGIDPVFIFCSERELFYLSFKELSVIDLFHGYNFIFKHQLDLLSLRRKGTENSGVFCIMSAEPFVCIKNSACVKTVKIHKASSC